MAWFTLPKGWFGPRGDNEVELVSTISDAVKYRGGAPLASNDFNASAFTGDLVDGDTRLECGGYRVGLRPDRQGGALRGFVCDGPGGQEHETQYADGANFIFRAGPFAMVLQGSDGNFVIYDTRIGGGVGDPAAATFAASWVPKP